ncbi:pyridoxamine 5'-phosphate oxidase family protein [Methanospirillum hungatei]|uniref:pyridoxamine 5'-phosphate oxidase family protein n=1 Tax=Methanospirillum hungatei TaxID=2203 RepID=UPI0026F1FCAF|nr:pyridoxamine 5'-phosphate oxidase family protein [Methanospirillum hungatei]MCA1916522.1 pyridoxamine 5'-phosphate oxidase family protein [Methanospirillum hungatei]
MTTKLMEYFNKSPRIGVLSTADKSGHVDSGIFGSPRMTDEKTVIMGLSNNRTLANLQQNPHAVYLIIEPGTALTDWKGIRVYLVALQIATSGKDLDAFKSQIAEVIGKEAADMIVALVTFEVTGVRPIVDMGQGWEQSI